MKKLWLFLLSLGLVMAFSVSAFAADVKFSGEYYAAGLYLNHADLREAGPTTYTRSTAFFYQRLRLGTDFVVSPCLRLVTRMDIMERVWEPDNTAVAAGISDDARNLDFDVAYIDYVSPIGKFQVGYMPDYAWGTIWANRTTGPTAGQIKYFLPIGPVTMVFAYAKEDENDFSVQYPASVANDRDQNSIRIGPIFNWKANNFSGETGVLFTYDDVRQNRGAPTFFKQDVYTIQPYFKTKIGPVSAQGEINYAFGERRWEDGIPLEDIDINSFSAFLDADANFGIVSIGGSAAFVQGQDPDDTDEINSQLSGGRDWDPCLIMFNNTTQVTWVAPQIRTWVPPAAETAAGGNYKAGPIGEMRNAWFVQGRIGITPIPKLTFMTSLSYAGTHEDPAPNVDDDYGWEVDVTGTYKITNNLTYMLGGAYLWTGDYFQAGVASHDVEDNYMIINKLTLNF
jgi:hypothetical protein